MSENGAFEKILWSGGPMALDEEQWASWKCGGGPHQAPEANRLAPSTRVRAAIVAYAGTESEQDLPAVPPKPNEFMANLPG